VSEKVWLPVKDGYNFVAVTFGGRHTERASVEGDWLTVAWRAESGDEIKASVQLPADLRLCQLVVVDEGKNE
jgi:hypothetical protein